MENDSEFGSVISLRSSGDQNRTSKSIGNKHRKSAKSSYASQQGAPYKTKGKGSTIKKKTGHEMWVTSLQNGIGLSAESGTHGTLNGRMASSQGSASSFLMGQLLEATGRLPKGSLDVSGETRINRKQPAYKTPEEYYDEVLELKKRINAFKEERELSKKKIIRIEEENQKQARTITELLNPNLQTNEMRRAVSSKSKDQAAVISSLQHKVFSLERLVKVKEGELSKLKSDMKYTDLNESRLEAEIYQQEVKRVIAETNKAKSMTLSKQQLNIAALRDRPQQMEAALKKIAEENARLVTENRSLKRDLVKSVERKETDSSSKDYEDMSRSEMLAKIAELDTRLKAAEKIPIPGSPQSQRKGSSKDNSEQSELRSEIEKLKETISKLKEDRSHYRTLSDDYRAEIEKLSSSVKQRVDSVTDLTTSNKHLNKHGSTPSRKSSMSAGIQYHQSASDEHLDASPGGSPSNRKSKTKKSANRRTSLKEEESDDDVDESVSMVQAALRGHSSRQQYLNRKESIQYQESAGQYYDTQDDDDLIMIQAALRGHQARSNTLQRKDTNMRDHSNENYTSDRDTYSRQDSTRQSDQRDTRRYRDDDNRRNRDGLPTKTERDTNHYRNISSPEVSAYERGLIGGSQLQNRDAVTVNNLKQMSQPWTSREMEDSEDEDMNYSKDNRSSSVNKKWSKDQHQTEKRSGDARMQQEPSHIKERWGTRKSNSTKSSHSTPFGGNYPSDDDNDGYDDDDDLVIGSSTSIRGKQKSSLLDELF